MTYTDPDTIKEALVGDDSACFIAPSYFKGLNATMVECALLGDDLARRRPQYAYRISEITEAGPVVIFEGADIWGPAVGSWPEPEKMAITALDWHCMNPDEIEAEFTADWTEAQREWNSTYGEGLGLVSYDFEAYQCEGRGLSLSEEAALWALTEDAPLVWLRGGPECYGERDEHAEAIARLRGHYGLTPG